MYKKLILGLGVLFISLYTQAQNNAIFFGGNADGWSQAAYQQVADENISLGGDDDGWSQANYQQVADEDISFGGEGDGWASVIYPLGPLPVELLTFTGHEDNGTHVLNWTTAMELNSSRFVIEHSMNASTFNELGMVSAAGNSAQEHNYTFTNKTPTLGNNFYRLKMVDIDQKFKYSNVILLKLLRDNTSIVVYPNPAASLINIEMNGMQAGAKMQVEIVDASGKLIKSEAYIYDNQKFTVDVSSYANGMYFLKIKGNTINELVKFSISK